MAAPVSSCYEKYLFWKEAAQKKIAMIDNLNWKGYSERELLCITGIQEPIFKTYE